MPKKAAPQNKQCTFREGGRRCMRNATGRSPFCRAHTIVAQDAAQAVEQRPGFFATANEILSDVIAGRGISREKIAKAVNEGVWEIGGNYTKFSPDLENVDFGELFMGAAEKAAGAARGKFKGAENFTPPPGWFRDEPREDPQAAQNAALQRAARQLLGFAPTDVLTADLLSAKKRELAKKWHPDRFANDPAKQKVATTKMAQFNDAIDVLMQSLPPA